MNTILLVIVLVAVLSVGYYATGERLSSPVVLFLLPLSLATVNGLFLMGRWHFYLSGITVALISLSAVCFVIVCTVIHSMFNAANRERVEVFVKDTFDADKGSLQKQWFSVPKKIYWFLIFFQIISSVILYRAEKTAVISAEMGGGGVFDIINKYNVLLKFSSEDVALSGFPALLAGVSNGFMYISAYLMVSELIHQSRLSSRLCILAFTVSILVSLVGGSRSNAFAGVISCVILFLVFGEMNGKIRLSKIRVKNVAKILALIIFIFIAFYALIFVLDRDGSSSAYEYMSIYLTAPIKNLDLALTGILPSAQFFGQYTFQYLYRALIAKYNFPPFVFVGSPHPFSYYDGRSLGNVYTIFRALMIDFGFWGSILAVMMIGVITQVTYEIVMRHRVQSKMYFSPIFYSFLGFNLMMSFFSENFYQNLVNTSFIKWMLSILIFSYIFNTKLVKK